jgi:hypothetical protein
LRGILEKYIPMQEGADGADLRHLIEELPVNAASSATDE